MLRKSLRKKADVTDIITFIIMIFFLATSFLIVAFTTDLLSDSIKETQLNDTETSSTYTGALDQLTETTIQNGFVALFAFIIIGMMISSFLVRIHPVFLFLYFIFLLVALFTVVPIANSYQMLTEATAIADVAAKQPMMNWVMEHLFAITIGVAALSMIITFAKLSKEGGGSEF